MDYTPSIPTGAERADLEALIGADAVDRKVAIWTNNGKYLLNPGELEQLYVSYRCELTNEPVAYPHLAPTGATHLRGRSFGNVVRALLRS